MKTIGLIGGMSWESTAEYYRIINQETNKRLGGVSSAKILTYSFNFAEIEILQRRKNVTELEKALIKAATVLVNAGAEILLICTNTMHQYFSAVEQKLNVQIIHIADAVGKQIKKANYQTVGLLGTQYTMEGDFYTKRLKENFNIDVIIPEQFDRSIIHTVIYEELVQGQFLNSSKEKYLEIIEKLKNSGAECIILGCTEIPLLIKQSDTNVDLFDTTFHHALAAVESSL
jgi:aspartate racemase